MCEPWCRKPWLSKIQAFTECTTVCVIRLLGSWLPPEHLDVVKLVAEFGGRVSMSVNCVVSQRGLRMYVICCSESDASIFVSLHLDMVSKWHKIQNIAQNVHLTFPSSIPPVRYKAASADQVFRVHRCTILRLFSKQLSRSSLNSFITCEMNSFQMFLETSKRPEVRQCQSRAVGCRTSSTAMLSIVATLADLVVIWRYPTNATDSFFQPLWGLHVRLGFDFPSLTM